MVLSHMTVSSKPLAIVTLLISNMVPLAGVVWGGWNANTIILLYWFESAVIGFFAVKKIRKTELLGKQSVGNMVVKINGRVSANPQDQFLSFFFMMHFGIFMFVHLIFLLIFFLRPSINFLGMLTGALSMCFSHYLSYQQNFIQNKEYLGKTADAFFWSPYPRVIGMHLAVILGGVFMMQQGQSMVTLAILILVKTIADVISHLFEHRKDKQL
jgi:hypothetical protein